MTKSLSDWLIFTQILITWKEWIQEYLEAYLNTKKLVNLRQKKKKIKQNTNKSPNPSEFHLFWVQYSSLTLPSYLKSSKKAQNREVWRSACAIGQSYQCFLAQITTWCKTSRPKEWRGLRKKKPSHPPSNSLHSRLLTI